MIQTKPKLLVILALFSIFIFSSLILKAEETSLKITTVIGDVQFENTPVHAGDLISRAGSFSVADDTKSQVDILYPAGHKIRLKAGTKMSIAGEAQKFAKVLNLLNGKAYMHFQKKPDVPEFQIHTKTAVAGVRGTKFLIQDYEGTSYLCVCEGSVAFSPIDKPDDARAVKSGEDLWLRPGKPFGQPKHSEAMSQSTTAEFKSMGD